MKAVLHFRIILPICYAKNFKRFLLSAAVAVTVIAFFVLKRTSGYVHAAAPVVVQHFASHKRNYDLTS